MSRYTQLVALAAACAMLAACSSFSLSSDTIDYGGTKVRSKPLSVPPDLTPLPANDRFAVPATASATASAATSARETAQPAASVQTVAPQSSDVRIERAGTQQWLAVEVPPEQAFAEVKAFLGTVGLAIEREDPKLGLIETTWAENRAKLPQDIIRRTIGRVFDGLYSTGEQDKYRLRVERTPKNTSEIFVSHRGMVEVYTNNQQDRTAWQPRPADTAMEAELLRRIALRFQPQAAGAATTAAATPAAAAAAAVPAVALPEISRVLPAEGSRPGRVQIDEPFDRAWRRVGLALDRGGFTVEDRDRAGGVYFVRYLDPEFEARQREKQGWLSRLFGDSKVDAQQFRVLVAAAGERAEVTVLDAQGKPAPAATGEKILRQLNEQLR